LTPLRSNWGILQTAIVPRTGNDEHKPRQMINDLIVSTSVYRNGGTCETTHLCESCLRVGLRHIQTVVSELLEDTASKDYEASKEIATLTEELGETQSKLNNLTHDHNRMQDRLLAVLALVPRTVEANCILQATTEVDADVIRLGHWEVNRGHAPRLV